MSRKMAAPNQEILRLAIPNIISNVSVPLLSTVDTVLMGQLSPRHLGAVGLGSMIFNFIYWNFGFLRMGTTGLTAQAFGAGNRPELRDTLGRALLVALGTALVLLLLQAPLCRIALQLMQVVPEQQPLVMTYFNIRIWAAPASLAIYVLTGWFFGMQNSIYPLVVTVAINAINVLLSYLFVMRFDMEVAGVAWSTVIAQYAGVILCVGLLLFRYRLQLSAWSMPSLFKMEPIRRFFSINIDLFIRTVCLTVAFSFFYSQSSLYGETLLAVNVILLQLVNWASYGIDGFAYAAESIVGKYRGAANWATLRQMIRLTMWWGLGLGMLFSGLYLLFRSQLIALFSDDVVVAQASSEYVWYAILFPVVGFLCYIWDGIYIGLTASRSMRNIMVISLAFYFVLYYYLPIDQPNHLLWTTLLVFLLIRGVGQTIMFGLKGWNLK